MDGVTAMSRIRVLSCPHHDVPIVAMTRMCFPSRRSACSLPARTTLSAGRSTALRCATSSRAASMLLRGSRPSRPGRCAVPVWEPAEPRSFWGCASGDQEDPFRPASVALRHLPDR
ncbi:hypothetical protein [Methylobacterium sp. 092160098-2]|uniref:hypothetical protein n=1 Tax=Methylobacterium sp. 092160098-2 TaxID=3025129 RepID=UPI00238196C2|nr:hypothetical protein [Methylobacterium sp. 092160098-2]MDE4914731.1 hypothetical protein [Methylobacterium sp. 092160098-2]